MTQRVPLPPSLYAATARAAPETPKLQGDRSVSVAIIGGGSTGLSTALHLAERGVDTAVLEANEPGWGASGRNGGQVNPGLKTNPDQVMKDFGPEYGPRLVAFAWGASQYLFDLVRRYQISCDARQGGTMRAAYQATHAAAVAATAAQCLRHDMPVELLDAAAAAEATGSDRYRSIMLDRSGGDLHPLDYARGLARAAMQLGASIYGDTRVLSLQPKGGRWRIATAGGNVMADAVVLGANGYTDDLYPNLRRSLVPVFSSIAATAPLNEAIASTIMPRRSSLYESGNITVYLRLDQQNRLLMGGRGPQQPIQDPAPVCYLTRYAKRLWPALADVTWTHGWNGQVAMTSDHYPHLHQPAPALFACLGYNGRGVALSTAMGAEIARHVTGAPSETRMMPTVPIKPIPLHGFWRLGVTAKVLEARIRDRLGL